MKTQLKIAGGHRSIATPVTELSFAGSNARLTDKNGEFNASNNADLIKIITQLANMQNSGQKITTEAQLAKAGLTMASLSSADKSEMVRAAFQSNDELIALGEVIAEDIQITQNRQGFMRRFFARQEIDQGQKPEVRMNVKNTTANIVTAQVQTHTQILRDNTYYPPEFYITARPYVEQRDIARSTSDLLEEKYIDALEAIMVQEDRLWKQLADDTVGQANDSTNVGSAVTTQALANQISQITRWGLPARYWLIANDIWTDIIGQDTFTSSLNATSYSEELIQTGTLGSIFGLEIISDQFRHQAHRVLSRGDMYVISNPEHHGQYTDRGGLETDPVDHTHERTPGRGWVMNELMSMVLVNPRTVARARRI